MNTFSGQRGLRVKRDSGAKTVHLLHLPLIFVVGYAPLISPELIYNWMCPQVHGIAPWLDQYPSV